MSAALHRIETERMVGERARTDHLDSVCALFQHPDVAATISPTGSPQPRELLGQLLAHDIEHWERHGFGIWLLRDHATGAVVGRGGLKWTYVAGRDQVEVAWAITPERWRQGLATELALRSLQIAADPLGLESVVAFTLPDNVASRRVMEKTGFTYECDTVHAGLPHVLYRNYTQIRSRVQPIRREAPA